MRGTLRNFGLKVGMVGTVKFEARIKKLVENLPDLAALIEPLLVVRRVLREQLGILIPVAHLIKLRYEARASIWSGDNLLATCGIGCIAAES
jgi:hypothetical protein